MRPLLLLLLATGLSGFSLAAESNGDPARTPVAQRDAPLSEAQLRELAGLRTKALARQRRHIMNCDSGHLDFWRYPLLSAGLLKGASPVMRTGRRSPI